LLAGTILDRVSSNRDRAARDIDRADLFIKDLGVIVDEKLFAMLGFIRRMSSEFRDPCHKL
jgi:hypothetical protein